MRNFVSLGFVSFVFLFATPVMAKENPFVGVKEKFQWAIEQVMQHKALDDSVGSYASSQVEDKPAVGGRHKPKAQTKEKPAFQTRILEFQTETDRAKVNATVTDMGESFIIDVSSDQAIQGWLLKRQSTRAAFLKGGVSGDNPYKCRIRADRPFLNDFGLTVYVTGDSVPAFVQLY